MTFIVPISIYEFQELTSCLHFKSKPVRPSFILILVLVSISTNSGYDCDELGLY